MSAPTLCFPSNFEVDRWGEWWIESERLLLHIRLSYNRKIECRRCNYKPRFWRRRLVAGEKSNLIWSRQGPARYSCHCARLSVQRSYPSESSLERNGHYFRKGPCNYMSISTSASARTARGHVTPDITVANQSLSPNILPICQEDKWFTAVRASIGNLFQSYRVCNMTLSSVHINAIYDAQSSMLYLPP